MSQSPFLGLYPSLLLDHFGAIGFQKHPITFGKLFGAGMVVFGMAIIQFQR